MNLKKWFRFFWTTLLVGVIGSLVVGLYFQATDPELSLTDYKLYIFNVGVGLTFSVLSQMGFFAYLMVQYIARAMFKRRWIWFALQWALILITFIDLIVLRVMFTSTEDALQFTIFPIVLMAASLAVAVWKKELTNSSAFTPTLFFMFVATSLELVPALRENNVASTITMVVPVFLCNAWQILQLHRFTSSNEVSGVKQTKVA